MGLELPEDRDHDEGWRADLLRGLGFGQTCGVQARLAAELGYLALWMLFLSELGYGVIAHDRRGDDRSDQTWHGNAAATDFFGEGT